MNAQRRLRIAYISTRPVPTRDTDTQQFVSTVDALAGAGADVDLIVPVPRETLARGAAAHLAEIRAFYDVHRPFGLVPLHTVNPGPLQLERPLHALVATVALGRRYDLVHTRSRATALLCAALNVPVVFETYRRLAHDHPLFARALARAARREAFLGVITHSAAAAESIRRAGIPASKLAVVHNGFDPAKLMPRLSPSDARAQLGLAHAAPLVVYTGNVQPQKGLDTVLAMAAATPEVRYLVVGGKERDLATLRATIQSRRITNVETPGWRPASELSPWLYAADVLIIPPTARPLESWGRTVLPMKVFEYLGAGRPILAPALPDIGELLIDGDNARLVPPDDTEAAVRALRGLLAAPDVASALATSALATSHGLTWDARALKILTLYHRWLAGR